MQTDRAAFEAALDDVIALGGWNNEARDRAAGKARALYDALRAELAAIAKQRDATRTALTYDQESRTLWLTAWANLTRDVAPLIAAFRDTPSEVTGDQLDRALDGMAEMQRIESRIGVHYFDKRDALAAPMPEATP